MEENVDSKYYLSEKMVSGFERHKVRHDNKGTGFAFVPKKENDKGNCLRANAALCPTDNMIICHNTMTRGSTNGNGGSGHLSRNEGKTYCLDTGNTNAVEILSGTLRTHKDGEGFREIKSGKGATIAARGREDGSGQNVVSINFKIRRLTPIECERLQTIKDDYTNHVSDSQRYKMIGNGWTVDVICHILNYLKK